MEPAAGWFGFLVTHCHVHDWNPVGRALVASRFGAYGLDDGVGPWQRWAGLGCMGIAAWQQLSLAGAGSAGDERRARRKLDCHVDCCGARHCGGSTRSGFRDCRDGATSGCGSGIGRAGDGCGRTGSWLERDERRCCSGSHCYSERFAICGMGRGAVCFGGIGDRVSDEGDQNFSTPSAHISRNCLQCLNPGMRSGREQTRANVAIDSAAVFLHGCNAGQRSLTGFMTYLEK